MTTKDEILRLLNREALTVQELAARLNVTRNAIAVSYTHLTLPTKRIV